MRIALAISLLVAVACNQKPSTTPPASGDATPPASDDGNAGTDEALEGVEGTKPSNDPTGAECVAKCLEGDTHKDLDFDAREAACKTECPVPESTPTEG